MWHKNSTIFLFTLHSNSRKLEEYRLVEYSENGSLYHGDES